MSDERSDTGGYMGWFLFGAVLGAAAAIFLTPKTGARGSMSSPPSFWSAALHAALPLGSSAL